MIKFIREFKPSKKILNPFDPFVRLFFPLIPKWIHPNHLTAARIVGTPFLIYLLYNEIYVWGLVLFIILALTDMFDGAVARGRDQITPMGILMDPIADKLLIGTTAAILLFKVSFLLALVIIGLEVLFVVGGVIKTATGHQAVDLEANFWGKAKMTIQVIGIGLLFIGLLVASPVVIIVAQAILWLAAIFAVANMFVFSL
jgi:CDP-diacylglycerol--glycerol-3-phosphate 3-phosphatidyltransferase